MQSVDTRQGQTARGHLCFEPWIDSRYPYSVLQITHGSNPLSKIEIVSSINSFNLSSCMYIYYYTACTEKYNPKVYLGAIQSVAKEWNLDNQNGQNWGEKSGSWL